MPWGTSLSSDRVSWTLVALTCTAVLVQLARQQRRKTIGDCSGQGSESDVLPTTIGELTVLLVETRRAHARTEKQRKDELAGRRKAEEQLRKAALQGGLNGSPLSEARYPIVPIGTTQSCFMECAGVPRQPGLADAARAIIQFNTNISPGSFDGLIEHSHVWVLFVFHCNTNAAKIAQVHSTPGAMFPSKIAPPRLGGSIKVGVLACRTPHHPNPIGLSLAKLESIDANRRRVVVCGSDLVDGTPILDIKPYIPWSDTPRASEGPVRVPDFTGNEDPVQPRKVSISALAEEQLRSPEVLASLRVFAGDPLRMRTALLQVLSVDVGRRPRKLPYILLFDGVAVQLIVAEGEDTEVQTVQPHKEGDARPLAVEAS